MDFNRCHSNYEASEDRIMPYQEDRILVHLMPFLLKDLAERSVSLDLGHVLVPRLISELQNYELL